MARRVPRTSSAAPGLGSNESMCVTPPAIHNRMTDRALPGLWRVVDGATCAGPEGNRVAAIPREPTRNRSRRFSKPFQEDGTRTQSDFGLAIVTSQEIRAALEGLSSAWARSVGAAP